MITLTMCAKHYRKALHSCEKGKVKVSQADVAAAHHGLVDHHAKLRDEHLVKAKEFAESNPELAAHHRALAAHEDAIHKHHNDEHGKLKNQKVDHAVSSGGCSSFPASGGGSSCFPASSSGCCCFPASGGCCCCFPAMGGCCFFGYGLRRLRRWLRCYGQRLLECSNARYK